MPHSTKGNQIMKIYHHHYFILSSHQLNLVRSTIYKSSCNVDNDECEKGPVAFVSRFLLFTNGPLSSTATSYLETCDINHESNRRIPLFFEPTFGLCQSQFILDCCGGVRLVLCLQEHRTGPLSGSQFFLFERTVHEIIPIINE